MEIKDLFSHKIHSSGDDWPNKLIDIASIFNEFDGKEYDRAAIEQRLSEISPRVSDVARDPSKFRDEISAYPAYLGLYRVELVNNRWHIFLSNTAKRFLVNEEPNVPAFMLLQMILFQYPNGMGSAYRTHSNSVRIQANTGQRTLSFIENNIHFSPLRIICKGIEADSILNARSPIASSVSLDEIFALVNDSRINTTTNPNIDNVVTVLREFRNGQIERITGYESRFHILKHTDFLVSDRKGVRLKTPLSDIEEDDLLKKFRCVVQVNNQLNSFDFSRNKDDLENVIRSSSWGKYFDSVNTLTPEEIEILTHDSLSDYDQMQPIVIRESTDFEVVSSQNIYDLKQYNPREETKVRTFGRRKVYIDPEITRIRRQKSNLIHKIVLDQLHDYLKSKGSQSFENEHIDLYSVTPDDVKYVFEVKSINNRNLLSQTRKGVSQLYEYRFRYQDVFGYDVKLFLVYPEEPKNVPWLQEYLCIDREIGIIWFDGDELRYSEYCEKNIAPLLELPQLS